MCFVHWDTDMFSDSNIYQMLLMFTFMAHSTTTTINNKIVQTNIMSQNTSNIAEYSASVINSVNIFLTS